MELAHDEMSRGARSGRIRPVRRLPRLAVAAIATLCVAFGLFGAALAENPSFRIGSHLGCEFYAYTIVNNPPSGLSYTYINTPSCQNGYAENFAIVTRCNLSWNSLYSDWQIGYAQNYYSPQNLCAMNGQHRMSKTGPDVSGYVYTAATAP